MAKEDKNCNCKCHHWHHRGGGAIYGLGFIGALIYYLSTAPSFWMGVLGVLKAIVWPAILVYGLSKAVWNLVFVKLFILIIP